MNGQGREVQSLFGQGGPEEPLIEGGNPAWNSLLEHVPEDKREAVVPMLKEWDTNYNQVNEKYSQWKELEDSNISPEDAQMGLNLMAAFENQPHMVYEMLGNHLGISTKEAKEMVEEEAEKQTTEQQQQTPSIDPNAFSELENKFNTMAQIMLGQKAEQEQAAQNDAADKALNAELEALQKQVGDLPENEILMRMAYAADNGQPISAEEAYKNYMEHVEEIQRRRPAPFVLGGGGQIPREKIDVKKLNESETKSLVAQMLGNIDEG